MKRYIKADIIDVESDDFDNRKAIALDPNTREVTLWKLSRDPNPSIREAVVSNPNVPVEILAQVGKDLDEDAWVLEAVAKNEKTPVDVLTKLLKSPRSIVHDAAAKAVLRYEGRNLI